MLISIGDTGIISDEIDTFLLRLYLLFSNFSRLLSSISTDLKLTADSTTIFSTSLKQIKKFKKVCFELYSLIIPE